MSARKQLATFFFSAAMIGLSSYVGGAAGGAIGVGIAGAMGKEVGEVLGEMTQELFKGVGEDGLKEVIRGLWDQSLEAPEDDEINHDLSKALGRAFDTAIDELEALWWRHPRGMEIRRKARGMRGLLWERDGRRTYQAMRLCFEELKADAADFSTERNAAFFFRPQTRALLAQSTTLLAQTQAATAQNGFMILFEPYFQELPVMILDSRRVFIQFIKEKLMIQIAIHLREEIKNDTKAWRAYCLLRDERVEGALDRIEQQGNQRGREQQVGFGSLRRQMRDMKREILLEVAALHPPRSGQPLEAKLLDAFMRLNYREQMRSFSRVNPQRVNAFLIHGPPMFGQRWLLNRLVARVLRDGGNPPFRFHLGQRGRSVDIDALWDELHRQLHVERGRLAHAALRKIYELWKTQTVVLIFHDIDLMSEDYLQQFIKNFWMPLKNCRPPSGSYRLLMFLVDYSGVVNGWRLSSDASDQPNEPNSPDPIFKLPSLTSFDERLLSDWALDHDFPLPLSERHQALRIIQQNQNGTPELVMQYICQTFHCDWELGVQGCLAY